MPGAVASIVQALVYGAVPAISLAGGGAIATYWPPSAKTQSYIQHVAAGLVFAAVGVEVLPDVVHRGLPLAAAVGFAIGVALMLAIRTVAERSKGQGGGAWTLIGVVVADISVDGLLIGVSLATTQGQGGQALLITVALAVELLALGLSIAGELGEDGVSRSRSLVTTGIVALAPVVGALAGYFLGGVLTGGWIEAVLAFAAAALLYLAAEELLKEAHEVPETIMSSALFFGAFLSLMLIDMVSVP